MEYKITKSKVLKSKRAAKVIAIAIAEFSESEE